MEATHSPQAAGCLGGKRNLWLSLATDDSDDFPRQNYKLRLQNTRLLNMGSVYRAW